MMKQKLLLYIVVAMLVCMVTPQASASIFDWRVFESEYFVVFYQDGYKYQAEELLYYLEKYRQETMDLVGNEDFKTLVILQDAGLESNAAAAAVNHKIILYTNNPSTLSRMEGSEGYNSWFKQMAIHELTHLAQISNASGLIGKIANLGGGIYYPNLYTPTWLKEGIAIYNESRSSQYAGRLNNGYYDSFIASKVQSGQIPDLVELPYKENEYIFGAKLINYLAKTYGEEKLTEFFKEQSKNLWGNVGTYLPALGIDSSAKQVFGKSFPELYVEWQAYEQERFRDWDMEAELVVSNEEGKISKLTKYENKLYYVKEQIYNPAPFVEITKPVIMEYDLKYDRENVIEELETGSNASLQVIDGLIYYSTKVSGIGVLFSYNLETGESEGHSIGIFKDFAAKENGDIIYVRDATDGFGTEIWRYKDDKDSDDAFEKIGRVDQLISEIITYQDEYIVVSKERFGSWNINRLVEDEEEKGEFALKTLINSPDLERSIKLDGDVLSFTANYNRGYALYQYDLLDEELTKVTSFSYASDGIVEDDKLYFVGVTATGEAVYRTEMGTEKYPLPEEEELEEVDLDRIEKKQKNAFLTNLGYLFKPYVKFPYLQGEDALGGLSYRIDYLDNFAATLMKENYESSYRIVSLSNYKSVIDGERKTNLQIHFDNNKRTGNLIVGEEIFYVDWGFYRARSFKNSSISVNLTGVYGYKLNGMEFVPGGQKVNSIYGGVAQLGVTHKLFGINKGIWNPNIYLGDLYGHLSLGNYGIITSTSGYDPYYPYSDAEPNIYTLVGSYDLRLETLVGFNERLVPSVGVRYSQVLDVIEDQDHDPKLSYFFKLSTGF